MIIFNNLEIDTQEAEILDEQDPTHHKSQKLNVEANMKFPNKENSRKPEVKHEYGSSFKDSIESTDDTYQVFENWAKRGDFPNQPSPHHCDRVCKTGESMVCRYTFVLELHSSMGKVRHLRYQSNYVSFYYTNKKFDSKSFF